ncbi:uncharacterized membrane protein-like protein [Alkaliphilus metalliredigens QYMF]|uniref:Uncharacterized membrane protein-like protein n=1 Tax=Alkaliphilus metalliredigens (strain QYMF) TaxID=293826 RepID=A6TXD2_ALKMQ|nr:hypothetical protein [Alkaliphilus metalliredigens]ABR50850.1 uncharacterized membrane protein-like protein [Alkaliphilus metalliredigens QYMF]
MKKFNSIVTLGTIYIGTVIGAGFASGQEIYQFFGKYGNMGVVGIFVMTILFSIVGSRILSEVYHGRIQSFESFALHYFNKRLLYAINLILILFLTGGYFIMLAGSGAVLHQSFEIPVIYGIVMMTIMCFIVFSFGLKGIAGVNNLFVPILAFVIIFVSGNVISNNHVFMSNTQAGVTALVEELKFFKFNGEWVWSAILYVSYNSMIALVVMTSVYPLIYDQGSARYGAILGAVGLGAMALLILVSLLILETNIIGLEVPMIAIAHSLGDGWKQIYSGVLLLAMFTTAVANGYACILRVTYLIPLGEKVTGFLLCTLSIPLAMFGFKRLVEVIYPIFGYIGFVFIVIIILKGRPTRFHMKRGG